MARIPIRGNQEQLNLQVPGVGVGVPSGAEPFQALARVGSQIAGFGAELVERQASLQDDQYVLDETNKARNDLMEFAKDSRRQPDGHEERVRTFIEQMRQNSIDNAPSDRARLRYQGATNDLFASTLNSEINHAIRLQNEQFVVGLERSASDLKKQALENPTLYAEQLQSMTAPYMKLVDSQSNNALTPKQAEAAKKAINFSVTDGVIEGLLIKDTYAGYNQAKALISNDSAFKQALTGDQVEDYSKRIASGLQVKKKKDISEYNKDLSNLLYASRFDAATEPELKSMEQKAQFLLTGKDKAFALDTISSIRAAQSLTQGMAEKNPTEWSTEKAVEVTSGFNARTRGLLENQIENTKKTILRERSRDSVNFIISKVGSFGEKFKQVGLVDPTQVNESNVVELARTHQGFISELIEEKKRLGITDNNVLRNQDADLIAKTILQPGLKPDMTAKLLDNYQAVYGPYFRNVMTQIVAKNKSLDSSFLVTAYADTTTKERIIDNLRFFREEKQFSASKDLFNARAGVNYDAMAKDVAATDLDQLRVGLAAQSGNSYGETLYNGLVSQVSLDTMRRFNNGDDLETAKANALKTMVDRNFTMIHGGDNQVVVVPKKDGVDVYDTDNIRSFLNEAANPDVFANKFLPRINPKVPPEFSGLEDTFKDALFKQQRWIPTTTGLGLYYNDPAIGLRPVYDQEGKPAEVSFENLSTYSKWWTYGR